LLLRRVAIDEHSGSDENENSGGQLDYANPSLACDIHFRLLFFFRHATSTEPAPAGGDEGPGNRWLLLLSSVVSSISPRHGRLCTGGATRNRWQRPTKRHRNAETKQGAASGFRGDRMSLSQDQKKRLLGFKFLIPLACTLNLPARSGAERTYT
jgi:hypothetical protein